MDQLTHGVLRFDRFALDLTRGFLRAGDRDIDLRPKAFEVLRHLAENAGRLVPKQELYEAVWPNATVTDDSLVQCIRELREKLGDSGHSLIKTVHRRGYLLDAAVMTATPQFLSERPITPIEEPRKVATNLARRGALLAFQPQKWRLWAAAAAAGLLCIAAGAIYLPALLANPGQKHVSVAQTAPVSLQPPPVSELFAERDAKRVAVLADKKQLPLPPFQIRKPAHDVPEGIRRFVGIWVSDAGWMGSNRQFMLIVTNVDREGIAAGYFVNGPSQPMSFFQTAAHSSPFKARISGDSLSYSGAAGQHVASLTTQGGIELKLTLRDGRVGVVVLDPVWTLVEAERAATEPRRMFKDCDVCPEMVALPAGEFMMGSPEGERGREQVEGLPRRVVVAKPIAIGRFEVTVDQFSAFVAETGTVVGSLCHLIVKFDPVGWGPPEASFRQPGYDVTGLHPVGCISWHEAQAYVAWLRRRTGKPYRLPTEAEWEYAARAGTTTRYSFGDDETQLCAYARFADLGAPFMSRGACRSDTTTYGPIQVGQLKPNPWGIFDMHGNVWEWVEDCWTPSATEIPTDGSAFTRAGSCEVGVIRGGSFAARFHRLRSAFRFPVTAAQHYQNMGFRVALSLAE